MSTKHKVVFHNFPSCSVLLDEIVMNHNLSGDIEFHTLGTTIQTIDYLKDNSDAFLIFYNDSPSDYIQAKAVLKQINEDLKSPLKSIAIVNNSDGTVQKSLRDLGVKDIFTHDSHSADIIEKMEFHLLNSLKKNELNSKKPNTASNANNSLNLVIDKNDYRQEEFSQVISENIDVKNINLDSGDLSVNFQTKNGTSATCTLENFTEGEIEISLNEASQYAKDDKVDLNIIFQYNRCKVELLLEGIIESSEKTSQESCNLTVKLSQDERVALENFMSLYQQRQKNINDFMDLAKGN